MPSLMVLAPLFLVIVLNLPFAGGLRKSAFWAALLFSVFQIAMPLVGGTAFWDSAKDPLGPFFLFKLYVDNLSLVMLIIIGIVTAASLLVAKASIKEKEKLDNAANLMLLAVMGMNALVMITGIFSVYVFIEVTAVASFILMAINRERRALEAAFKYLIISSVASLFMLFGIGMLFLISGDTTFAATAAALNSSGASGFAKFGVAIFVAGLLIKSGVIPFHGWLPDAYQAAPRSVSVFLAGIVTKISGVYVLMRLVYSVFGLSPRIQAVLMFFGAASIVLGAVAAIGQKDLKRMLAYSSVSQVGYIVLSVGCGTPIGILGAVFHFFNHAVFKSLLFVNAAALEEKLGTTDMSRMGGLGSKMPVTSFTSIVGFLSTGGIPPLSGFWSKLIIILALWTAGHYAYAVLAVVASALTLSYFVIMQKKIFFGKTKPELEGVTEPGMAVLIPEIALAAITIIVGLAFPLVMNNLMMPAANILR